MTILRFKTKIKENADSSALFKGIVFPASIHLSNRDNKMAGKAWTAVLRKRRMPVRMSVCFWCWTKALTNHHDDDDDDDDDDDKVVVMDVGVLVLFLDLALVWSLV